MWPICCPLTQADNLVNFSPCSRQAPLPMWMPFFSLVWIPILRNGLPLHEHQLGLWDSRPSLCCRAPLLSSTVDIISILLGLQHCVSYSNLSNCVDTLLAWLSILGRSYRRHPSDSVQGSLPYPGPSFLVRVFSSHNHPMEGSTFTQVVLTPLGLQHPIVSSCTHDCPLHHLGCSTLCWDSMASTSPKTHDCLFQYHQTVFGHNCSGRKEERERKGKRKGERKRALWKKCSKGE